MKPDLIGFHLFCVTLASFCYAQNGYQYPRPTGKPASKPSIEQSRGQSPGQNEASRQPNSGFNQLSQNQQSLGHSSSNGYQYNRPAIPFTTSSPQPQTIGFPTSQSAYPPYVDSSTASNAFHNENAFTVADGGYTQPGPGASLSGYSSRPGQSLVQNGGATPLPGSNSFGTTSTPAGYQGGPGPGTFGSELQGPSATLGPNPGSVGSPSNFNSESTSSPGQSSPLVGYPGPGSSSSFNTGGVGSSGPSSTFSGNYGFGMPSNFNPGNAGSAGTGSTFFGNTASGSSSNFNAATGGNGISNDKEGDFSAIPGAPNADYPVLAQIPRTAFNCASQKYPGYYADVEARCQVFHICANGLKYDFLCPNGTIFSQMHLVCVWWNQFDCTQSETFYYLNENLYKGPSGSQGQSPNFSGMSGTQQAQGAVNNYNPSAELQGVGSQIFGNQGIEPQETGPQGIGSQGVGPQEFESQGVGPQGPTPNFGSFTNPQMMTSVNFSPSSNTPAPFNQQPTAFYGPPSQGAQRPLNTEPQKPPSFGPPVPNSQNNYQPSYPSNGQFPSSSGPFPGTAPPEYSKFLQATTAQPGSYQTGVKTPSNSLETSFQNYPSTESNQETKPSREYLPPFRKRR